MQPHPLFTKYLIGKNGDVINRRTNRKMKCRTNNEGYLIVGLMKDKKQHTKLINRLVLETYNPIENDNLYHAHHKNHIRNDNKLENLEWVLIADHMREHNKGVKKSDEARKRMSEANKGKVLSEETRKRMSESHKGVKKSEETRRKMSEAKRNTSDETRRRMSEMKWWNNGTRTTRSKECPGEGWMRGRITVIKG